jgi:hypothetical protein
VKARLWFYGQRSEMHRPEVTGPVIEDEHGLTVQPLCCPIRREVGSVPPDRADMLSPEGLRHSLPMLDGVVVKHHTSIGGDDLLWDRRRVRLNPFPAGL